MVNRMRFGLYALLRLTEPRSAQGGVAGVLRGKIGFVGFKVRVATGCI
jgi:hypothetical protein